MQSFLMGYIGKLDTFFSIIYSLYSYKCVYVYCNTFYIFIIMYVRIVFLDSYSIVIAFTNIFVKLNATEQRVRLYVLV